MKNLSWKQAIQQTDNENIVSGSSSARGSIDRASDFPRSRKSRGIRGIANLKRNFGNSPKKKKKNFFFFFFFKCQSYMAFSSVLSFLLSTHSFRCTVPLLLSIHMLIVPFFFSLLR